MTDSPISGAGVVSFLFSFTRDEIIENLCARYVPRLVPIT